MRLALAISVSLTLILALSGQSMGTAAAEIQVAVDLGLLPCGAAALPPEFHVTRALWAAMLYEALGAWLPVALPPAQCRDVARDRDGDVCARIAAAGWMKMAGLRVFRPSLALSTHEAVRSIDAALASIEAEMRRAGAKRTSKPASDYSGLLQRLRLTVDDGTLGLAQAALMLRQVVEAVPAPGKTGPPEKAVHSYLENLAAAVMAGWFRPPLVPVCGAAAANLTRNTLRLKEAVGDQVPTFGLVSVEVMGVDITGMVAAVTVRRRMTSAYGGSSQESHLVDLFRLRLSPAGWLIFR